MDKEMWHVYARNHPALHKKNLELQRQFSSEEHRM